MNPFGVHSLCTRPTAVPSSMNTRKKNEIHFLNQCPCSKHIEITVIEWLTYFTASALIVFRLCRHWMTWSVIQMELWALMVHYLLAVVIHWSFSIPWSGITVRVREAVLAYNIRRLVRKTTMWFPNRSDTNQAIQSQKQARILTFRI